MSTLVRYSFPGPLVHLPPSQPSHHKVLISVTPKKTRETPGSAWPPSQLMYAACSACPAIITREAVSTPERALDKEKGLEFLWWIVLKPQANRITLQGLLQPHLLPCCTLLHTLGPLRVCRHLRIGLVLFSLSNYHQAAHSLQGKNIVLY